MSCFCVGVPHIDARNQLFLAPVNAHRPRKEDYGTHTHSWFLSGVDRFLIWSNTQAANNQDHSDKLAYNKLHIFKAYHLLNFDIHTPYNCSCSQSNDHNHHTKSFLMFLSIFGGCGGHSACVRVHVYVGVHACGWRPDFDFRILPLPLSTLVFEMLSHSEHGAPWYWKD